MVIIMVLRTALLTSALESPSSSCIRAAGREPSESCSNSRACTACTRTTGIYRGGESRTVMQWESDSTQESFTNDEKLVKQTWY